MPDSPNSVPLLEATGISKNFGGAAALKDVSLSIAPGEVHALLGANGAGKSTLIKIISGIYRPDEGELQWYGELVHHHSLRDAMQAGIAVMFQQLNVVEDLTVGQYMALGRERTTFGLLRKGATLEGARQSLRSLRLDIDLQRSAGTLSVAERELVEVARAVSLDARLVIMDEPTASLGGTEVERLLNVIRSLRDSGVSVLYVSHKLEEVLAIADRSTVLRDGQTVATLRTRDSTQASLVDLMVGERDEFTTHREKVVGHSLLEVRGAATAAGLRKADLTIRAGEVVGVYGLMGSGRTELIRAIFGVDRLIEGEMLLDGEPWKPASTSDSVRAGLGLVPEDRIREALIGDASVTDNITLASPEKVTSKWLYSARRARRVAAKAIATTGIKVPSLNAGIGTLSGGNQQKVVISRWLVAESRLLLLDDPTVGVDVAAKDDIYKLILKATDNGVSVLVCSSELDELMKLADRIVVMFRGGVVSETDRVDCRPAELIRMSIVGAAG